jgi:hypothetical protein
MKNDPTWKKSIFMTLVVIATAGILGVAGFYLWFVFPVQKINGLTYLRTADLIIYYGLINLLDVVGVNLFARALYFRWVKTARPLKDGIGLGAYLLVFCWLTDILVYVLIRKTLPTVREYFLGKNQPEIGIAWVVAFCAAVLAGWLEARRRDASAGDTKVRAAAGMGGLILASIVLTAVGIGFFDIRP